MDIGKLGENIAVRYLKSLNYKIIERNHKEGFDEIDIIGLDSFGILIFFEVKTSLSKNEYLYGFMPEDNFSLSKLKRISRACMKFAAKHPDLIDDELGWQIDLITIQIKESLSGEYFSCNIRHYKNHV